MDQEAFFTSPLRDYFTLADVARELGADLALVKRLVEKHGVAPAKRHGVIRLWKRTDLKVVRTLIDQSIAARTK